MMSCEKGRKTRLCRLQKLCIKRLKLLRSSVILRDIIQMAKYAKRVAFRIAQLELEGAGWTLSI